MKIKHLSISAITPVYSTPGAGCFDLHASEARLLHSRGSVIVPTGLAFEVPPGHVMLIFSRSGHGFRHGVRLANAVGVIDADYRGEVQVCLHNDSTFAFTVDKGDRIAQALIMPVEQQTFEVVAELSKTSRGTQGFGSTGLG